MDEESKYMMLTVKWAAIGIVGFTVACVGSCQMTNYQIRRAIDGGAPPLTARCALSSDDSLCEVLEAAEAEAVRNRDAP